MYLFILFTFEVKNKKWIRVSHLAVISLVNKLLYSALYKIRNFRVPQEEKKKAWLIVLDWM